MKYFCSMEGSVIFFLLHSIHIFLIICFYLFFYFLFPFFFHFFSFFFLFIAKGFVSGVELEHQNWHCFVYLFLYLEVIILELHKGEFLFSI